MFDKEADKSDKSVNLAVNLISLFNSHCVRLSFDGYRLAFNTNFSAYANESEINNYRMTRYFNRY